MLAQPTLENPLGVEPPADSRTDNTAPTQGNSLQTPAPLSPADVELIDQLNQLAGHINALVDRTLDPEVDVAQLLTVGLARPYSNTTANQWFAGVLWGRTSTVPTSFDPPAEIQPEPDAPPDPAAIVDEGAEPPTDGALPETNDVAVSPDKASLDPLEAARHNLETARARFFSLSPEQQGELRRHHELRQQEHAQKQQEKALLLQRIDSVQALTKDIHAFVRGELALDKEPSDLLRITLDHPITIAAFRTVFPDPVATAPDAQVNPDTPPPEAVPDPADATESDGPDGSDVTTEQDAGVTEDSSDIETPDDAEPPDDGSNEKTPDVIAQRPPTEEQQLLFDAEKARAETIYDFLRRPELERTALLNAHAERREQAAQQAQRALEAQQAQPQVDASAKRAIDAAKVTEQQASAAERAAVEAAAARVIALAAAAQAADDARRSAEEERARLLGIQEQMSLYEANLLKQETRLHERHAEVLEWSATLRRLRISSGVGDATSAGADAVWDDLMRAVAEEREAFADAVTQVASRESHVVDVAGGMDLHELPESERAGLQSIRDSLRKEETKLRALEDTVRWQTADARLANVLTLNEARQDLIPLLSDKKRAIVTGFGGAGVDQVRGAINQAYLLVKFRILSLPRLTATAIQRLQDTPLSVLQALFELIVIILLFRWWKKRADPFLNTTIQRLRTGKSPTRFQYALAATLWYVQRIHRPLEWLILGNLLLWALPSIARLPEVGILWLVIRWTLTGFVIIRFVDAIADRFDEMTPGRSDTAALRYKSLRLVGQTIVAIGLILSLTGATVGRGVIYRWVARMCWLMVVPVAAVLIYRWRAPILRRLEQRVAPSAFTHWVLNNSTGILGMVPTAAGGLFLLGQGLYRWMQSHVGSLAISRRIHAYLFRREVTRQARQLSESDTLVPISTEEQAALCADTFDHPTLDIIYRKEFERAQSVLNRHQRATIAVIGERGIGKSTLLRRFHADRAAHEVQQFQCPPTGYATLRGQIAETAGVSEGATDAELVTALWNRGVRMMIIDDVQRMVRPIIGGLQDLDKLRRLPQSTDLNIDWVFGIGLYAWQYIHRARGERPLFDLVLRLGPWTEVDIAAILVQRTTALGLAPRFEDLVVQPGANLEITLQTSERTREGYYRILWDYSDGNPAIALHFWAESLHRRTTDATVQVRLCAIPQEKVIETLPVSVHFVLRTLFQLELAYKADIVASTLLSEDEVNDALRHCVTHGIVENVGETFRVTREWYRAASLVLRRQHLLMS